MQLFSADAAMFLKKIKIEIMENMEKPPAKVAHNWANFFFIIVNKPKTSPNQIFCSIKMSSCARTATASLRKSKHFDKFIFIYF